MMLSMVLTLLIQAGPASTEDAVLAYQQNVRPVLERRCFACHGALRQESDLRLDTAQAIRAGGASGPAVTLGDSDASLLIAKIVEADPKLRMPPDGEPVSQLEVAAIRAWIAAGAPMPDKESGQTDPRSHWAFRPPIRSKLPDGSFTAANPIDAFLEAARRQHGLTASTMLSRDLWLRRVTLDLVGLPPTPAELQAFRADDSARAFENVVDRLLASPQHGERWARHWMDIWRYSDWYGLGQELRFSHYHIWRWRDWIIESLNSDMGFDRMIVEMLAGDELAPESPEVTRATGFLARNWDIFNRNKWLDTTIEHSCRAFLGITIQCARCHDHKFDPISQIDYYRLRAVFEPYQIRIDRVPGQSDRAKDGVVRAFDDYLDAQTFLFLRGDETQPDTRRAVSPGTPAVLGGSFEVRPVKLPVAAFNPDKRPFVIEEARTAADRAVAAASQAMQSARHAWQQNLQRQSETEEKANQSLAKLAPAKMAPAGKPDERTAARDAAIAAVEESAKARRASIDASHAVRRAEAALAVAEAARQALNAVLAVEDLEESGAAVERAGQSSSPSNLPAWTEAARGAVAAQRRLTLAEAIAAQTTAEQTVELASTALDGLLAVKVDPKDPSVQPMLQPMLQRATTALVDSRAQLAAATSQRTDAESALSQPLTTEYTPRPLEFPRAKITYRDTPSNAPYATSSTGRRLAFARWIADRRNPLTARVAANQIWARHFGEPLVPAVFDFGLRSPRPMHLELLDWLAVELMESGWNLKQLHRSIVTSHAYRMRSSPEANHDPNASIDPDNHYYWRMNPRRMEAEVIRDSLLLLGGRLDTQIGGPDLPVAAAEDGRRRTVYYRYARGDRMQFLTMFDAPSIEECYRRHETIVPQQALALTNSKLVLDRSDDIAGVIRSAVDDAQEIDFVTAVFARLLGRLPTHAEHAAARDGLERLVALESTEPAPAAAQAGASTGNARDRAEAAFVHVLLNHNDFITIR